MNKPHIFQCKATHFWTIHRCLSNRSVYKTKLCISFTFTEHNLKDYIKIYIKYIDSNILYNIKSINYGFYYIFFKYWVTSLESLVLLCIFLNVEPQCITLWTDLLLWVVWYANTSKSSFGSAETNAVIRVGWGINLSICAPSLEQNTVRTFKS